VRTTPETDRAARARRNGSGGGVGCGS